MAIVWAFLTTDKCFEERLLFNLKSLSLWHSAFYGGALICIQDEDIVLKAKTTKNTVLNFHLGGLQLKNFPLESASFVLLSRLKCGFSFPISLSKSWLTLQIGSIRLTGGSEEWSEDLDLSTHLNATNITMDKLHPRPSEYQWVTPRSTFTHHPLGCFSGGKTDSEVKGNPRLVIYYFSDEMWDPLTGFMPKPSLPHNQNKWHSERQCLIRKCMSQSRSCQRPLFPMEAVLICSKISILSPHSSRSVRKPFYVKAPQRAFDCLGPRFYVHARTSPTSLSPILLMNDALLVQNGQYKLPRFYSLCWSALLA